MKTRIPALLLALLAQDPNRAEPRHFRYQRAISITNSGPVAQTCAPLDATAFEHSAPGLADLRVFDGDRQVPFAMQSFVRVAANAYGAPSLLNKGKRNGAVALDARMNQPSYSTVEITTAKQNFIASVAVSGGAAPDAHGATQLGTYTVFDLTGQHLGRSARLHLPASTFPYLHFVITGPLAPADITGLRVIDAGGKPAVYSTVATSSAITQQDRRSVITFRSSGRVPVDRFEIVPAAGAGNFSRTVTIEARRGPQKDPEVFQGRILRVHTQQNGRRIDEEQTAVDAVGYVPPLDTTPVHWMVSIDNGDDAPLAFDGVRMSMRERLVCFDASPGATFAMYYGDSTLPAPRYDYATVYQPDEHTAHATLAAEEPNPTFAPRPDSRPFTERYAWLVWAVLVAVVLSLGAAALRAAAGMSRGDGTRS